MNKIFFLLPYFLSFAISLGVLIYTLRFRGVQGAKAYAWYVGGQTLWIFGYILELVNPGLNGKMFWDQIQWVAGLFITVAFPVFAIQYTKTKVSRPRLLFSFLLVVSLLFLGFLLTDNTHHRIYSNPYLDNSVIFSDLKYDFTWFVYTYAAYGYLATLTGVGILLRRLIKPHHLYRRQIITVAIGFIIPIFFTMLTTAGVEFKPFRDVSPFTFAVGNIIVAWGLFRYRLFDVIPIARELVVENMEDLVVVLDRQDRIIDINPSALAAINQKSSQIIGQPAETVLARWPELLDKFEAPENIKIETTVFAEGRLFHYEVKSTLLHDRNGRYIGRVFVSRDISEHTVLKSQLEKLNEELEERVAKRTAELQESIEFTEIALNSQTDTFFVFEISTGKAVRWNKAFRTISGYSDDEIRSLKAPDSYYNEKDLEKANAVIQRLLKGGTATVELSLLKKDGNSVPTEYTATTIKDAQGDPRHIIAIGRDITKRIKAEKLLLDSEERLRAIVDAAPFGAHLYKLDSDEQLIFIGANHSADQILQIDHQHLIGKTIEEAFPPLAETDIPAAYRRVATSGEHFQMDQVDYDDTEIRGAFEIHAFRTAERRMAVFFRDITERKRAEEALIESEERFSTLADASFEGIVISDKGRVMDCNKQMATMLGYEQSEMIGLEVNKFVPPESLDTVLEHIRSGSEEPYEHLSLRKDGTKFPVEIHAKSIPFKGRQVRVTAVRDITERKQAEAKLMEAYDTTLEGWARALELRDKETEDHSRRVTELTIILARAMGIEGEALTHIRRGAILHDIGKMAIPDEILRKRGPLTASERKVVEQHPTRGLELLSKIPYLKKALDIPYCHHEHWDGSGYPQGLKGTEIPLAARIFSIIDVWDALLSDRPYSKAWSKEKTIQYIKDESGKYFDPECVSVFLKLVEQGKI